MKSLSLIFFSNLIMFVSLFSSENNLNKSTKKDYISNARCLVSGDSVDKNEFTNYKNGKIYFCCEMCKADFKAEKSDKFSSKANFQLVFTNQYIQKACPITGKGIDKTKTVSVNELDVAFCCNGCKSKTEAKKDKVGFIFANTVFDKAFYPVKSKSKPSKK